MKLNSNRAGKLITHPTQYQYFLPTSLFDIKINIDEEILNLLGEANLLIGKLDGISTSLPDKDIFISMYVQKEAVISSQIEGTQTTLDDILQSQCTNGFRKDIVDVINYTKALNEGVNWLTQLPISSRYFKKLHNVLLKDVRGANKQPGEFRTSQNWIGPLNCSLSHAIYVPVCPDEMNVCLNDLEKFINNNDQINPFIKIALIHYQFETIHPFLDGNGRVGRILIPLWLIDKKIITNPLIYISLFFKENISLYYSLLMNVRQNGEYEQWIKFFLKALIETTKNSIDTINKIVELKNNILVYLNNKKNKNKHNIKKALDFIYKQPYFTSAELKNGTGLSKPTIKNIINFLLDNSIVVKKDNKMRNSTYCFSKYVNILKPGTEL